MYPLPTPASDSYGTPEGVAALAMTWTNQGSWLNDDVYIDATNPSLTSVVNWIDQISAILNTALANYGFVVPLTEPKAVLAATSIVESIVSDIARYVNQKGRFFSDKFQDSGKSIWESIREDLDAWVKIYAPGLELNGAERGESNVYKIGSRGQDAGGEEIFPIFQRKGFGNVFTDWTQK